MELLRVTDRHFCQCCYATECSIVIGCLMEVLPATQRRIEPCSIRAICRQGFIAGGNMAMRQYGNTGNVYISTGKLLRVRRLLLSRCICCLLRRYRKVVTPWKRAIPVRMALVLCFIAVFAAAQASVPYAMTFTLRNFTVTLDPNSTVSLRVCHPEGTAIPNLWSLLSLSVSGLGLVTVNVILFLAYTAIGVSKRTVAENGITADV